MSAEIIPMPPAIEPAASADLAPVLHLVHVRNPLAPSTSREQRPIAWQKFKPVAAYLEEEFGPFHEAMTVSLNGRVLSAVERAHVLPRAGDYLVVAPSVEGGSVWRTLAQVAVMAAAVAAGVFLGPEFVALGWASSAAMGTAMAGIAAGLVSIGGSMLINTFMGLSPASKGEQPSWAFSGPKTLAQPGVVIPKGYGTYLSGGNVISSFIDLEGTQQYINALVSYGFGPARAITGLTINGKDISTYEDVQYYIRMGTNDQSPIPAFNRIVNGYPQATQVTCDGGPVIVPGVGTETQAIQVDIMFPTGVYYTTGDGNLVPCKVVYKVEYSVSGSGVWAPFLQPRTTQSVIVYHSDGTVDTSATPSWVLLWTGAPAASGIVLHGDHGPHTAGDAGSITQTITSYDADGSHTSYSHTFQGEWQPIDYRLNMVEATDWMEGWIQYVNDTTEVCYNRTSIYGLTPGKYDVRVTKWGSNNADNTVLQGDYDSPRRGQEVWLHSVNEITYQDLSYPNMILIGIRALATNQLSGANINIAAQITYGLRTLDENILPAALQVYEEDNPALVAADMMLDQLYGGGSYPGVTPDNIERFIDEWLAWAQLNDTLVPDGNGNSIRLHVFNGIFDNEGSLWTQLQTVGRMSRACIIPMGRDYGVFVNQADTPVQLFTVGNVKQDSFEETWLALDDRANQIEIEFADSTRYYQTDNPIVYMDPADMDAGAVVKNVRIRGTGITIPAQAWHLGHFLGLSNQKLLRTGKFETDVEGIACRPGNLIILQHDVPQWGWGGRTLPGSSASVLNVDRNDLAWDGATAYNVIVLFPSIQRYTGAVTSVATDTDSTGLVIGTNVGLSSFDNTHRVTRAVINGIDCPVLSAQPGLVLVTLPPGFTPVIGQAYTLYDTDVLETATVANVTPGPNGTSILTLGVGFTQAPDDFSTYFYGQPGSQKIVRVTNIRKSSDFRATIEWIDYDASAYDIGTPVVGETSAQVTTHPGVTSLSAVELIELESGSYVDYASLTWKNGTDTAGAAIYGKYAGMDGWKMLGRLTGRAVRWKFQVSPGVQWTFKVVGFDARDYYDNWASAPTVTFAAVGITANLLSDSSFQSGFVHWNLTPRAGDTLVPTFANDGEAEYTVVSTSITATQPLINQVIPTSLWSVGTLLMLSAYFEATGTATGNMIADIAFLDSSGTLISTASASVALGGVALNLTRVKTAATAVPTGTASIRVRWYLDGTVNAPAGSVLKASHFLLEVAKAGQTVPSIWADVDAKGHVLDVFQLGSSASLRAQGSSLPTYTGAFPYTYTDTSITPGWMDLEIQWPDGGITEVMDGQIVITGLTASTTYYAYLYFDIIHGGIKAVTPASPVGSPAFLSLTRDSQADAACRQDGRIAVTPGGLVITTAAAGQSGSGTGTGGLSVTVSPSSVVIAGASGTASFSATVTLNGVPQSSGVTWSNTGLGTIDSSGNYTGPGGSFAHGGAGIVATSVVDPTVKGGASLSW